MTNPIKTDKAPLTDEQLFNLQLVGPLVRLNQLSILIGPPGIGKRLLTFQISKALVNGTSIDPEILPNLSNPLLVMYVTTKNNLEALQSPYNDLCGVFAVTIHYGEVSTGHREKYIESQLKNLIETLTPNVIVIDDALVSAVFIDHCYDRTTNYKTAFLVFDIPGNLVPGKTDIPDITANAGYYADTIFEMNTNNPFSPLRFIRQIKDHHERLTFTQDRLLILNPVINFHTEYKININHT